VGAAPTQPPVETSLTRLQDLVETAFTCVLTGFRAEPTGSVLNSHACVGANLKATQSVVEKATTEAQLAIFEPPLGTIRRVRKRGTERFPNERGQLTNAGALCLERGVRRNLIVWTGRRDQLRSKNVVKLFLLCAPPICRDFYMLYS
jgi:hypothetical protein